MNRIVPLAGTALVALALVAESRAKTFPRLEGDVGPGFTIHLTQNGKPVRTISPGTYSLTVSDKSTIHNFRVKGPGFKFGAREITGIGFTGTRTTLINFVKATYTYVCTPHSGTMKGTFDVS